MESATLEQKQAPAKPASDLSSGVLVWVLFWRSNPMPDGTDRGAWSSLDAIVISTGKLVCVEIQTGAAFPTAHIGAWDAPHGSRLRFCTPDRLFDTPDEAVRFAGENNLKPGS